jgi:hypothetical protein
VVIKITARKNRNEVLFIALLLLRLFENPILWGKHSILEEK